VGRSRRGCQRPAGAGGHGEVVGCGEREAARVTVGSEHGASQGLQSKAQAVGAVGGL